MKSQAGKDIVIFGSPSVSQLLMQKNLIDIYWIFINAIIFGKHAVIQSTLDKIKLKLFETMEFPNAEFALGFMKLCVNQLQNKHEKRIGYSIIILLIGIQFIRPARNLGDATGPKDIASKYAVPQEVSKILEKSCYDCHSNHTDYPWYTNIQPVGWWMQWHVNEGKHHLNYTEFASYEPKRARGKFKETADQVKGDEMPLNSYLWIHRDEILSIRKSKFS
jgi:hypothetical protein